MSGSGGTPAAPTAEALDRLRSIDFRPPQISSKDMADSETFMLKMLNLQIVAGTAGIRDEIFNDDATYQGAIPAPSQSIYRRWILMAFESEPSTQSRISK